MSRRIHFYKSFEEQKNAEIKATLAMLPMERIRLAVQLTKKVYGKNKNKICKSKRITFVKTN